LAATRKLTRSMIDQRVKDESLKVRFTWSIFFVLNSEWPKIQLLY
jgi:hypothetical protein